MEERSPSENKKNVVRGVKYRNDQKIKQIPIISDEAIPLKKPSWMKMKLPSNSVKILDIKSKIKKNGLHSVCEEADCPNLAECFNHGTATFMILGDICTRRCSFCAVAHGRPLPPDEKEPYNLAKTIKDLALKYIVITSVDRDDLRDGGATHFTACIESIREHNPNIKIEILVPDFRGRIERAVDILKEIPPDVFNHNIETIPRLYKAARPGADYQGSLDLLAFFKEKAPDIPTKSGVMVGLGETEEELLQTMKDLRAHNVTMLTIGQYLQPSKHHYPVQRYVTPAEFARYREEALALGFTHVSSGPFVRSSYHAEEQAKGQEIA